ncbi:MAG: hypothetical protein CMJ49_00955 [Planctomycetaceae bacterium]|nr:hypothetical protein [Planctomycetaceae bacterium]
MNDQSHDAQIFVFAGQELGPINGRLFGQFLEIAGRCVNDGIYDPQSPHARADGVRTDVLEAIAELNPTHIRYPGGCGTAYFDWQELVGPVDQRPRAKLFRYTAVPQATAFGIPEAWALTQELGCELYMSVNAHTQTPEDAANLVEYLNGTTPTKYADLRRAHGREEPYNVKLFGLGNEIYGDWQPGAKTADEYVAWCREAITQMKNVDPEIELIVCGAGRFDPDWDRTVLKGLIDRVDMISMHNYFGRPLFADAMAGSRVCDTMIQWSNLAIDEAMDTDRSRKKRPGLVFDEWNVWYRATHLPEADNEEIYDYADALVVASLLHCILRNTSTITVANFSLAVNVLGAIFTDPKRCVRQTVWYPQKLVRDLHAGAVVRTMYDGPTFSAKHGRYFEGVVDVSATHDEASDTLLRFDDLEALDVLTSIDRAARVMTVSVVNKLEHQPITAKLNFHGVEPTGDTVRVHRLTGDDPRASNTLDSPDNVGIESTEAPRSHTVTFPPASYTLMQFTIK